MPTRPETAQLLRALAAHLRTVPDEMYDQDRPYLEDGCGCALAHATSIGIFGQINRAGDGLVSAFHPVFGYKECVTHDGTRLGAIAAIEALAEKYERREVSI